MPATEQEAVDQIHQIFFDAATPLGVSLAYEGVSNQNIPPSDGVSPWIRIYIQNSDFAGQSALTSPDMGYRYTQQGAIFIDVFGKNTDGFRQVRSFAETLMNAYRGKTTSGGVWFFRERIKSVEPEGQWARKQVIIEFEYDTVITP